MFQRKSKRQEGDEGGSSSGSGPSRLLSSLRQKLRKLVAKGRAAESPAVEGPATERPRPGLPPAAPQHPRPPSAASATETMPSRSEPVARREEKPALPEQVSARDSDSPVRDDAQAATAVESARPIPAEAPRIPGPEAGARPPAAPDLVRRAEDSPRPADAPRHFEPFSDNRLALLAVDPYWLLAYWKVHARALEIARTQVGDAAASFVLRFHDVKPADVEGTRALASFDISLTGLESNYYVNLWSPGKSLVAELGARAADGKFVAIVRSNTLELPLDVESSSYKDERRRVRGRSGPLWKPRVSPREGAPAAERRVAEAALASSPEDVGPAVPFATEWSASGSTPAPGVPRAASPAEVARPQARPAVEPLEPAPAGAQAPAGAARASVSESQASVAAAPAGVRPVFEGVSHTRGEREGWRKLETAGPAPAAGIGISSLGISSLETPRKDRKPYLEIKADIVIYGTARPGTQVVIDGVPVAVRDDGTFDLRFSLPPPGTSGNPGREAPGGGRDSAGEDSGGGRDSAGEDSGGPEGARPARQPAPGAAPRASGVERNQGEG